MYLIYFAASILLTLMLHEIAHGYVAWKCGDPTAKMLGRLSMDPRRHLDPLGTLFLAWYLKGTASISYEYQLDGYDFKIRRLSGMRQKPVDVLFASLDLRRVIIIGDQDGDAIFEAEAMFQAAPKHRRVTYYTSAQNPDKPSIVLYAHGYGPEEGYIVRVYLQPSNQLLSCLRKLCPGKVHSSVDAI